MSAQPSDRPHACEPEDGPKPSGGGSGDDVQFGKIPYALIDAGIVRRMTPADVAVYLVICAHNLRSDWRVWPSFDRIASLTPYTRRSVVRSVARLRALGVIEVESGGGRGNPNRYRICLQNRDTPVPVSKGDRGDTVPGKQGPSGRETGTPESRKGDARVPRMREKEKRRAAIQNLPTQQPSEANGRPLDVRGSAAAGGGDIGKDQAGANGHTVKALQRHGLDSAQYLLGEFPNATADVIDRAMSNASRSAGVGARVEHFRQRVPAILQADMRRQAREESDRRAREAQKRAASERAVRDRAEKQERDAWLRDLPEADRDRLRKEALAGANPILSETWRKAGPEHPGLKAAMYSLGKREGVGQHDHCDATAHVV